MIHHISTATAQEAYASTTTAQAMHAESAKTARKLAAAFDGAFVSCKLQEKIQGLFPAWRVHYYAATNGDKYVSFNKMGGTSTNPRRFEIRLVRKGERRIDAADLIRQAESCEEWVKRYAAHLEIFWDRIGQYNALAGFLSQLENELYPVMYFARNFHF